MNRKVLVVTLLLLFIGASGVRAQMKTIEDNGGVIVYGVVNATKTAVAMGSILHTVQNNCGERATSWTSIQGTWFKHRCSVLHSDQPFSW